MSKIAALPEITFAGKDAEDILSDLIARYEEATGERVYPGDPVRLFLDTVAYELAYQRNLIDYAGKMNLLAYATGDYLDHLGAFMGVYRLAAAAAACTVRFSLSEPLAFAVLIPAGTRVTNGGDIYFATGETAQIASGESYADVACTCTSTGTGGNGFIAGQISTLVDPVAYIKSVANIDVSSGGSDVEGDDNLRERIQLAPEAFSVAGSAGAYKFWARSAHQDIVDVAVLGPNSPESDSGEHPVAPGEVHVFPLMRGGQLPSETILALVGEALSEETVRPLTDNVSVLTPEIKSYNLNVTYYIDREDVTFATEIQSQAERAAAEWVLWQKERLGRDINVDELTHRMKAVGVKRLNIAQPVFTKVGSFAVAVCGENTVTFGGLEDG